MRSSMVILALILPVIAQDTAGDVSWLQLIQGQEPSRQQVESAALGPDGSAYVAGWGHNNSQSFLAKYSSSGTLEWLTTLQTPGQTIMAQGVAVHGDSAYVVAARNVYVNEGPQFRLYSYNVVTRHATTTGGVVAEVSPLGQCIANPFGPNGAALACPSLWGVHADASGVYVAGSTYEIDDPAGRPGPQAFLTKLDPQSLQPVWTRKLPLGKQSFATSVSGNGNKICVSGTLVKLEIFNQDAFLACLDTSAGTEAWRVIYSPEPEYAHEGKASVFVSSTTAYVAGWSEVDYPEGRGKRAFLLSYDLSTGLNSRTVTWNHSWIQGVSGTESSVYVIGTFTGLYAQPSPDTSFGTGNISVRKCDSLGSELWTFNFISPGSGTSIAAANDGVLIGGANRDDFVSYGAEDGVVARIREIPLVWVAIDIKPRDAQNSVSLTSNGGVPVAILSSSSFDARQVDPLSITLLSAGLKTTGNLLSVFSYEDVNKDKRPDLLVHIDTQMLRLANNDEFVILDGRTYDNSRIRGKDRFRIVP